MSKHNYSQYSEKKKADVQPKFNKVVEPVETPVTNIPVTPEVKMEVELVQEAVETVTLPKTVAGVVVNCSKLNIREAPSSDADVICVLDVMSEVEIDVAKSDDKWFKVFTSTGVEGYCMRKFVDAHL